MVPTEDDVEAVPVLADVVDAAAAVAAGQAAEAAERAGAMTAGTGSERVRVVAASGLTRLAGGVVVCPTGSAGRGNHEMCNGDSAAGVVLLDGAWDVPVVRMRGRAPTGPREESQLQAALLAQS
jgi:hypothetical protein